MMPVDVLWFEQSLTHVLGGETWLSPSEANHVCKLRIPKRRTDWLLGRWTAKNAVAICLDLANDPTSLRDIQIRASPSGAPEVLLGKKPASVQISISHRNSIAACLVSRSDSLLGCDLEVVEPHSDAFVVDYFTVEERAFLAQTPMADRLRLLSLFWSAKESALKVLREGLRLDPRQMSVSVGDLSQIPHNMEEGSTQGASFRVRTSSRNLVWNPLKVCHSEGRSFTGWWNQTGNLVRTCLAVPPPHTPIFLA